MAAPSGVPRPAAIARLPSETIILGFTGPLGSGCTYVSEEVARQQGYLHYSLSKPISEKVGQNEGFDKRQTVGNNMRRESGNAGILALKAIEYADDEWQRTPEKYKGLVLDGIRNVGEVELLSQFPNFFLFAVHAEFKRREQRLRRGGRLGPEQDFGHIDERDSEEGGHYGQQVKKCTYLADVIFNNEDDIPAQAKEQKAEYVRTGFINKYVLLIHKVLSGEPTYEHLPSPEEALMTMAYCMSKRSSCLKRKVGAVVATAQHDVVSAGYNEVPRGNEPCVFDAELGQCARDRLQEEFARNLKFCPSCGSPIATDLKCSQCGRTLDRYHKSCPHCKGDAGIVFKCKCGTSVYDLFLPGSHPKLGKLLDVCRALHAEENAIINLAKNGTCVPGDCVLYTTTFPCNLCANKIVAANIGKVVYAEAYTM
ncbi:MAG: hypothetical protein FJY85_12685, partial [Deltaproteobacteria bacterium]|nr:hypothetical protein [Deltaproteobacteria bacterium]